MFSHVALGSNDIERSRRFYDAIFATLGGAAGQDDPNGRLIYLHGGKALMVGRPIDGEAACHANGGTIGLVAASPEQVLAWHQAGVAHGGTSIEDAPGPRGPDGEIHAGFLRDPDGNKLCCLYRPAVV